MKESITQSEEDILKAKIPRESVEQCEFVTPCNPYKMHCNVRLNTELMSIKKRLIALKCLIPVIRLPWEYSREYEQVFVHQS